LAQHWDGKAKEAEVILRVVVILLMTVALPAAAIHLLLTPVQALTAAGAEIQVEEAATATGRMQSK
jgi:hypothetical protein